MLGKINNYNYHNVRIHRQDTRNRQYYRVNALHREGGVPLGVCGVREAVKFENHVGIQINNVCVENLKLIVYSGPYKDK